MNNTAGWYIGRIDIASVASVKGGTGVSVTDTVFQWTDNTVKPTVTSANITGLVSIVGGPYPSQAAATAVANGDKNTTTGVPGTGKKPGVSTSTVNSSNGHLPNPLSALESLLGDLTSANLWIRVAKVIAGGVILTVGLIKLTGADKTAGGIAAKAVKVAPLL